MLTLKKNQNVFDILGAEIEAIFFLGQQETRAEEAAGLTFTFEVRSIFISAENTLHIVCVEFPTDTTT